MEVLILAPQTTLWLILSNVVIMVIAVHILRLSEDFLFPAYSLWLQRMRVDIMWEFNIEDKSVSAQRAEHVPVSCAEYGESSIRLPTPDEVLSKPQPGNQPFFSEHPP